MSNNQVAAANRNRNLLPGRRGDTSTRALGQSESSMNAQTSALRWVNHIFEELEMKAFEDITAGDVENEELEMMLHCIISHAASHPYVTSDNNNKVASASTIVNYFGIVKNLLRAKFPNHPEWPQSPSDNPIWYKDSVANFKKEYERSARTWSEEDYQRGSNKIRALYRYDHRPDLAPVDHRSMALWYGSDHLGKCTDVSYL